MFKQWFDLEVTRQIAMIHKVTYGGSIIAILA